jgi:flagellar biosynthesis/type III secretory pathway chaperone
MSSLSNTVCPYCKHSFKNEKLMLRHQITSKTCLHKRGIKTENEASVDYMKNTISELNHKIISLNEELKTEKDKNEILLNKISKLGNIMNMIKPHIEEIIIESFYKD